MTTETLRPDGNGSFTDWNGTYTDWYEASPDDDTTYVKATGRDWNESSTLDDPTPTDGMGSVKVIIRARRSGASDEKVQIMLVVGGERYLGASYSLTTSYAEYVSIWYTNPSNDSDWGWSVIDSLEAGVVAVQTGSWTGELRVTQLYVVVSSPQTKVSVQSKVDTSLTPETTLTLRPDGDGTETDWNPCRTIRPTGDGTFTNWTGGYGDWDDWPTHNGDTDSVNATADALNQTSQLENHAADETWDIDKVRVVAYARSNVTTDEQLTLTMAIAETGAYDSSATAHTSSLADAEAAKAHDGDLGTYPAGFQSGSTDYVYVHTFSTSGAPTSSPIASVDFKMKWLESGGGATKQYRILYTVTGSATETVLVDWTGDDKALSTDVWTNQPEPNGGGWTWTEVESISFKVETQSTGGGGKGTIEEYEAWVTVNYAGTPSIYEGTSHSLTSSTYEKYTSEWTQNPMTTSAWTWSDIDTLEAGVTSKQVTGSWTGKIMVTQLYVEIVGDSYSAGKYKVWDETTHNDLDYMSTTTQGDYETSTVQNYTDPGWDIAKVMVTIVAKASSDQCEIAPAVWAPGDYPDVWAGAKYTLNVTYQTCTSEWALNPSTYPLRYWTWSDINALEAGAYSKLVPGGNETRVSQVYVEVYGPRLTLNLTVADVPNGDAGLVGWQAEISYDPNIIQGVWIDEYYAGPSVVITNDDYFLGSAGGSVKVAVGLGWNNTLGKLFLTSSKLGAPIYDYQCPGGSGDLATFVFTVVGKGETEIHLDSFTGLKDFFDEWIIKGRDYVVDGSFRNVDSGSIPAVSFGVTPVGTPVPLEGYNTTFTAIVSGGTGSYDTYKWYFWTKYRYRDGPALDGPIITSTPTTSHNYTRRGSWNVTLTVIDSAGVVGTNTSYILIQAHDVAITKIASNTTRTRYPVGVNTTLIDKTVQINVTATNQGDFPETFNVTCFWDCSFLGIRTYYIVGTQYSIYLTAGTSTILNFYWDTTGRNVTHATSHTISANASRVQYEYDIEWASGKIAPNQFTCGDYIRVQYHDMVVTTVATNATGLTLTAGALVAVQVTVSNHGDFNETSIVVWAFAQKSSQLPVEIGSQTIPLMTNGSFASDELEGNDTATVTIIWDTSGRAGNYTIWANVTQANWLNRTENPGSFDPAIHDYVPHNNILKDLSIWVDVSAGVPEFPLGLAVETTLAAAVIYIWWRHRRKTKPPHPPLF